MKRIIAFTLCAALALVSGCKKDGSTPPTNECISANDFNFPASATKFSATLYSQCTSVATGSEFFVKFVLYNVSDVFGAATEFSLPSNVELIDAEAGPFFSPLSNTLILGGRVNNNTAYAFGITFKAGTASSASGSGVLVKLRLRATAAGTATFAFDRSKLEIKRSDGTPIANFGTLAIEDLTVTIR